MFDNYSIKDLYLASIRVIYPDNGMYETNIGDSLKEKNARYVYPTVIARTKENTFIDLKHPKIKIKTIKIINPIHTSYCLDYSIPFATHYRGIRRHFSRERALLEGEKMYDIMIKEHFEQLQDQQEGKSL